MTRINIVPVNELMDQHIMAEYFELPRIFKLVSKHWSQGKKPKELGIPETYRLGAGHMKFFCDKLLFLQNRMLELGIEGAQRGLVLEIDPDVGDFLLPPVIELWWWNDYQPTPEALEINRARLRAKISMYPSWYRKNGIPSNRL